MTFIKRITMVIAPFMVLFLFSFKSSANALPEVSQATFEVIEGGMQDMLSVGSQYKGLSPFSDGIIATYEIIGELYMQYMNSNQDSVALWTCDSDDVIVQALDSESLVYFENISVVDRYGHSVDPSNIYYVSYDNGYFHGGCYIDQYGDLLYNAVDIDLTRRKLANIAFGGNLVEWDDFNNFYDLISEGAIDNQMNFSFDDVDYSNLSYLFWGGYYSHMYAGTIKQTVYLYCPNICNYGQVQCRMQAGTLNPKEIWFNIGAPFTYEFQYNLGDYPNPSSNVGGVDIDSNNYGEFNYTHYAYLNNMLFNNGTSNLSYSQFMSYNPQLGEEGYFIFANNTGIDFATAQSIFQHQAKIFSFLPLQYPDGSVIHPDPIPDEMIDVDDVKETVYDPSSSPELNPDFDPSEEISPTNYPELNPISQPFPVGSVLPNSGVVPDPSPIPVPIIDPSPLPVPEVDMGDGFTNIPAFQNLQYRFPFSIPWDLKTAVGMLVTPPEPPAWDFYWDITVAGHTYSYHCVGDLSDFNDLARLLRLLFLISALVSLAVITYKLYF